MPQNLSERIISIEEAILILGRFYRTPSFFHEFSIVKFGDRPSERISSNYQKILKLFMEPHEILQNMCKLVFLIFTSKEGISNFAISFNFQ